jgi:hypothetical protein
VDRVFDPIVAASHDVADIPAIKGSILQGSILQPWEMSMVCSRPTRLI